MQIFKRFPGALKWLFRRHLDLRIASMSQNSMCPPCSRDIHSKSTTKRKLQTASNTALKMQALFSTD